MLINNWMHSLSFEIQSSIIIRIDGDWIRDQASNDRLEIRDRIEKQIECTPQETCIIFNLNCIHLLDSWGENAIAEFIWTASSTGNKIFCICDDFKKFSFLRYECNLRKLDVTFYEMVD